jgi:hypothetical protein
MASGIVLPRTRLFESACRNRIVDELAVVIRPRRTPRGGHPSAWIGSCARVSRPRVMV